MVSSELEREYTRRGVGLIEADEGCRAFLDELERGAPDDTQVLLMKGDPSGSFAAHRSRPTAHAVASETGAAP